jgi:hypothetical protein
MAKLLGTLAESLYADFYAAHPETEKQANPASA